MFHFLICVSCSYQEPAPPPIDAGCSRARDRVLLAALESEAANALLDGLHPAEMAAILQPLNTRSQPTPAPPVVVVLLGALPTLIVLVGLLVFGSIWAAVFGVETSWVLSPAVVCWVWPASRKGVADDWHAATQRLRLQALVGAGFWMASAASAVLGFWLLGRHTGVRRRASLQPFLCQQTGVCS